jgi:methyl-accepting chemotaxis protein
VIPSATSGVRAQLRFAFAVIILLSFVSTAIAIWRLHVLADDTQALVGRALAKERLISNWAKDIALAGKRTEAVARADDPALPGYFAAEARDSAARVGALQRQVGALLDTPEEQALYQKIGAARQRYSAQRERVATLKADGADEQARTVFEQEFTPALTTYVGGVDALLALQRHAIDARAAHVVGSTRYSSDVLLVLCLATLAFSIGAGMLFARALFRRLGGEPALAAAVAAEIAGGNLAVAVPLRAGDTSSLMAALERMRAGLADIVGQVRQGAGGIDGSVMSMASETQELSRRTESQAQALEETAASMEQLTQAVAQSAANAGEANALAADAARVARRGGTMVGQLVDTMGAIDASAARIADITGVIDGLAFQTNLLALNAAVEAARAGEQGRGFAVVAQEVRALAQRSAAAAKEIKGLIDVSTERVAHGAELAEQAGRTMGDIVAGIDRVTGIMDEIATSSREQAIGIGQVNEAMVQMDGVTQQNAALVEESAMAAADMREQAGALVGLVALFRVDAAGDAAPAAMADEVGQAASRRPARGAPALLPAPAARLPGGRGRTAARGPVRGTVAA